MEGNNYRKFFLMLVVSFVIMYTVMFLNVFMIDHVYLSLTRLYMTLLMVSPMALMMLLFMSGMYKNKQMNLSIGIGSVVVFILTLTLLRTQTFVGDEQYMQAMIPHHSSAILTSTNADLKDPEVKKLAEGIIDAQKREIAEMKQILARMKK
ncbi:DUF305 domain-containing protein [Spirosoma spitsbergense]|uniref:DUF305 domain-containing protein n=1 Tax=Spirosoma spitsbergense TaxID=431554 RepID=UPI000360DE5F|nr:DUF305 domain-containing protein [Spirosoma spitsbergense]